MRRPETGASSFFVAEQTHYLTAFSEPCPPPSPRMGRGVDSSVTKTGLEFFLAFLAPTWKESMTLIDAFKCPVCGATVDATGKCLSCGENLADRAKSPAIEGFVNMITDMDWGWWPVLFLRPPKNRNIQTLLILKLTGHFRHHWGRGRMPGPHLTRDDDTIHGRSAISHLNCLRRVLLRFQVCQCRMLEPPREAIARFVRKIGPTRLFYQVLRVRQLRVVQVHISLGRRDVCVPQ